MPNLSNLNSLVRYVSNLNLVWNDYNQLSILPGACSNEFTTNDIVLNETLVIPINKVGINGLDVEPKISDRLYAVYLIGDSFGNLPTASIYSLDAVKPLMPIGYDLYRRIAWVYISSTSSDQFETFVQYGNDSNRNYYYPNRFGLFSSGISTVFETILIGPYVPTMKTEIFGELFLRGSSTGDEKYYLRPTGSTSTDGQYISGFGNDGISVVTNFVPCGLYDDVGTLIPSIEYKVSGDSPEFGLAIAGYRDYL